MPAINQLPPPNPPAIVRRVSQAEASKALKNLKVLQLGTPFEGARPSEVPGLVTILLPDGKIAYSDISGRYYIVGVVFDLETGNALDGALDGQSTEK